MLTIEQLIQVGLFLRQEGVGANSEVRVFPHVESPEKPFMIGPVLDSKEAYHVSDVGEFETEILKWQEAMSSNDVLNSRFLWAYSSRLRVLCVSFQ